MVIKSTIVISIEEINDTVRVAKAEQKTREDGTPSPQSRTTQMARVDTMSESVDAGKVIRADIIILVANAETTIDIIPNGMTVEVAQLTKAGEGEMMKLTSEDNPRPYKSLKR